MKLQERDYTIFLNDDEREAFELEEIIANRKGLKNNREFSMFSYPDENVREFFWHKRSLYPNNYLHLLEYKKLNLNEEADKYHNVIYSARNEQESGLLSEKHWNNSEGDRYTNLQNILLPGR